MEYSPEAVESAVEDLTAIFERVVDILGYADHVEEEDLEALADRFRNEIVPALVDLKIYPEELSAIIEATDECLTLWEDNNVDNDPKLFSDLYTKLVSIIDTERLGGLIFEIEAVVLGAKLERAEKKYSEHSSTLNLRKLEYYRSLSDKAKTLGREKFVAAMEVILFGASSFNSSADFEDGISVSTSDTLEIMKRQGERFLALPLTEEDWQTVAAMCEEYLPTKAGESLGSKIFITLNNDNFFIEAADVMPALIKLYAALISDISSTDKEFLDSGSEYAYEAVIARQIVKHESEFGEFMLVFEEKLPGATSSAISSVKAYDKAGYNAFVEAYNTDLTGLMNTIKAFAETPCAATRGALTDAYCGYMARLNPVVAYVYFYL